jgi:hypothetical protein
MKLTFLTDLFHLTQTLETLNLASNEINGTGGQYLANALKYNTVR